MTSASDRRPTSTSLLSTTSINSDHDHDISLKEQVAETITVATPTAPDAAQVDATAAATAIEPAQVAALDERKYPEGIKLFLIMVPVYISLFLVSLDRIIIATAIPRITDEFKSFGTLFIFVLSGSENFTVELNHGAQVILNGMAQHTC